jgi:succinate dehydrogenase / fumarate reductase iron-sulfur subunit
MGEGGITDCGNAQVCVEVCPKSIPLTESIADIGRQTTLQTLKNIFMK